MHLHRAAIAVLALASAGSSFAVSLGTNTARYTGSFGVVNVRYSHSFGGGGTRNDPTVRFNGDRTDLPAGPGVNTIVPDLFHSYCVEVGENISLNAVHTHTEVFPLLGSRTDGGGFTGPVVFDAVRTRNLQRLWGSFFASVTSNTTSAAFQLAQWEIAFDNDLTLVDQPGARMWVNPGHASAASNQAEAWLTAIRTNAATAETPMLLLRRAGLQDQVTPVPEPATLAALGIGLAAVLRRRKRRA
jgi:hypothetical protein